MIKITKELLSKWFKEFNHLYFNDAIKHEVNFKINNNRSFLGQFNPSTWTISITTAYIRSERNYINTFLHEMCHLYVREKYGSHVQAHGYEWKEIANTITRRTEGKYGTIRCVGGGLDKNVPRKSNGVSKYVVFTDYNGNLSIAKYSNEEYINKLLKHNCISDNTEVRYYVSENAEMDGIKARRANGRYIRWTYSKWSLEEIDKMATLVSSSIYNKFNKAA